MTGWVNPSLELSTVWVYTVGLVRLECDDLFSEFVQDYSPGPELLAVAERSS